MTDGGAFNQGSSILYPARVASVPHAEILAEQHAEIVGGERVPILRRKRQERPRPVNWELSSRWWCVFHVLGRDNDVRGGGRYTFLGRKPHSGRAWSDDTLSACES
ncbi:hypothetical protein GCM10027615_37600 [Plantactinospora veratri]